jgi:hypothetical protein
MVQAHENVPLKTHDKTFLREVPASMRRHHCDERPPRPARRAAPFSGEHKRVREGISGWGSGKGESFSAEWSSEREMICANSFICRE